MTPSQQTNLYSYKKQFDFLINLYKKKKLPNKILFSGKKGIGKSTFALHLINFIFSENEQYAYSLDENKINDNNKSYKLINSDTHPNFFLIDVKETKKDIDIAQIRKMIDYANKSSFNDMERFVIIDNVENLNIHAANSLLKILEEPTTNLNFILILDSQKKILKTISSRCIKFDFSLHQNERIQIISSITEDNFYERLSNDFKNTYLSPKFYFDLHNFFIQNNFEKYNLDIEDVLFYLFEKKLFKKNTFFLDHINHFVELYFYKMVSKKKKIEKNFNSFNNLLIDLNNTVKYNLDFEPFFLKFMKIVNDEK